MLIQRNTDGEHFTEQLVFYFTYVKCLSNKVLNAELLPLSSKIDWNSYDYFACIFKKMYFPIMQNKPRWVVGRNQAIRASDHRVPGWSGQTPDHSTSAETGPAGPPQVLFLQGQTLDSYWHYWPITNKPTQLSRSLYLIYLI